jgi:hypothetical protein
MQIIKWLKRKSEKKYNKLVEFYLQFEIQIPSLQFKLYKKFPRHKWITFLILNSIEIGFFIFWILSLYYVSWASNECHKQLTLFNLQLNNNCTDYTCSNLNFTKITGFMKNITDMVK